MTDYSKLLVALTYSENADYTSPELQSTIDAYEDAPTEVVKLRVSAATGGSTVDLGNFTTVDTLIVKNLDDTNFVTAAFQNAAASAQSQKIASGAATGEGKILVATDVLPSADLTLTADTAACICDVYIFGD